MRILPAALAGCALAMPAGAAPLIFSGVIQGSLGYGNNPYLSGGENQGAGFGSLSFSPSLTRSTSRSSTSLSGNYYRQQYFSDYGSTDSATVSLSHTQQLTEHLTFTGQGSYSTTRNAFLSPGFYGLTTVPTVAATPVDTGTTLGTTALTPVTTPLATATAGSSLIDALTIGQRTNVLAGSAGLSWQATERDSLNGSVFAQHSTYGGGGTFIAGDYDQYGVSGGYLHSLSARTRLGFQATAQQVNSGIYGSSHSVEPGLSIQQVLSPIWSLNGTIGVIFQHSNLPQRLVPTGARTSQDYTGLYFTAQLCGAYPRTRVCLTGARQSTPSGYGGLRTDIEAGIDLTHQLTEHSSVVIDASYDDSRALGGTDVVGFLGDQRVFQARGDYSRQLGRRLSGGFGARFQRRDFGGSGVPNGTFGNGTSVAGTINLSYVVGRIR